MQFKQTAQKFDEFRVTEVSFLYEQDGPNEGLLKDKLSQLFRQDRSIERAYLVMARLQDNSGVVLGLATRFGPEARIVKNVQSAFASVCNTKEHLDVLFLTAEQEAQLTEVCKPFFRV